MARTWSAVLARIGTPTGDGRIIAPGALSNRDLPLPLMWQEISEEGHGGARVVGRIESLDFGDPSMVRATGTLLESISPDVMEQIGAGVIGPSVDLDDIDYVMDDAENLIITQGRIAGATLVSIPAFAEVSISLDPEPVDEPTEPLYELYASAGAPVARPPADWFASPDVDRLTPLTVTDTGRVFGHVAAWGQCHVGLPGCVTAPSSPTDYQWFHLHSQALDDGSTVPVGVMTVGGGHAAPGLGMRPALDHYDNVGTAVARVRAGEDEYGIWVAGWVLPEATEAQREAFMSSPVSGDWRQNPSGQLDLVALCSVNTPGFPVPRARVSFSLAGGQRSLAMALHRPVSGSLEDARTGEALERTRARWKWLTTIKEDI